MVNILLISVLHISQQRKEQYIKIKQHYYYSRSLELVSNVERNGYYYKLILCPGCYDKYRRGKWRDINMNVNVLGYHICVHVVVLPYTCADYIFFHERRGKETPTSCPLQDGGLPLPFAGDD